jgi:hypothetical protein
MFLDKPSRWEYYKIKRSSSEYIKSYPSIDDLHVSTVNIDGSG